MADIHDHIKNLNTKLQQLLKQHAALLQENAQQKKQLETLQSAGKDQKEQLEMLHQKNLLLKASADASDPKDKKELEQKINSYLRNIDKCISLLSHKQNV